MMGYMLLIFPLNGKLKKEFSDVDSLWYADDGAAAARLKRLIYFFKRLCELGPIIWIFS